MSSTPAPQPDVTRPPGPTGAGASAGLAGAAASARPAGAAGPAGSAGAAGAAGPADAAGPARPNDAAGPLAPTGLGVSTATRPADAAPRPPARSSVEHVGFWRAPFARRTWSELLFLVAGLVTTSVGITYAVATVGVAAGVAVTVVGLFAAGAMVVGARGLGALHRAMARGLLGVDVPAPPPFRRAHGFWRSLASWLFDPAGWRALAFCVLSFVTVLVGAVVSLTFWAGALGAITYGIWYRFLPWQDGNDGLRHRGASYGDGFFVDTTGRIWAQAAVGVVLLLLWPQVQRGLVHLTRLLVVNLLGPTRASLRVADLERSRGRTVEDADARLRRIERDLHDGTQARLVAVAMQLGEAKEALAATPGDAAASEALGLVAAAHDSTKEALTELREIARGIRPPVLDAGLAAALETLAARSPVRTVVDVEPGVHAAPAIEALVYFAVSELVTNAAKHAHASTVWVLVEPAVGPTPPAPDGDAPTGFLRVRVRDDGVGGASVNLADPRPGAGSGIAGLVERVRAVDGTLDLVSPPGAGTRVQILLPAAVGGAR